MQSLVLEFEDRRALDEAVAHLWDRVGMSGELVSQRLAEGRYRLEVIAEKPLRGPTLEKAGGRVVAD